MSSVSQNTPVWKQKKTLVSSISIHFRQCFCVSNKKKSHGKKLTPTQHLPDIGFGTLLTTVLAFIKNDDAWSKIDFQDMYRSKHTLGGPINYRTMNSSSKIAELKHNLMHKCTTFLASRLFHRFSMSALSGSTPYHNALSNKISSERTS